jgi:predicted nucleic acid-binding protein
MVVVSDTSPIVCLAHVKHINLLQKLFEEVLVPPSVYNELLENKIIDSSFLQQNPFFQIKNPENTVLVKKLKEQLDIGESEAIALSIEEKPEYLLIDESLGREVALLYHLSIKGTLGILLLAKERNLLPEIKPLIYKLQEEINFRIKPSLLQLVLQRANEQ